MTEQEIERALIEKLGDLKYTHRPDIRDRAALEQNFRQHFEALNRVHLTDSEFHRLLESIITPDVYAAARHLRERNHFERDDGTPLYYTLVNIKDWCKNSFEVVNQLRINTDYSHHRYDVILLINGVPVAQIELKTLAISPRRAMQQIVDYKNDPGNGYSKTLLCFLQLFIVSNRSDTWYFANNNTRHFSFDADERFLPLYQFASEANQKITHLDQFRREISRQMHLGRDDQPLHGAGGQRTEIADDAPLSDLCGQGHRRVHPPELRQRLCLAHHRQRQDADLVQDLHLAQGQPGHR